MRQTLKSGGAFFQDKYYDLDQAISIQKFLPVAANYSSIETIKGHNKSK